MKILVAYDGTLQSKEALISGIGKVREAGGEVVAMQVFDRGLFVGYDAIPFALSVARQEAARHLEEAKGIIEKYGSGIPASLVTTDGDPEEAVLSYAREMHFDTLLCPPRFHSLIRACRRAGAQNEELVPGSRYLASSLS